MLGQKISWLSRWQLFGKRRPVLAMFGAHLMVSGWLLLGLGLWQPENLLSGLYGCLVFILPNAYFAHYVFRYSDARFAAWIVRSVYWGQMGKMLLTLVAMALVYRFAKGLSFSVFAGIYVFLMIVHIELARRLTR